LLIFPNQTGDKEQHIKITLPLKNIFSTICVLVTR